MLRQLISGVAVPLIPRGVRRLEIPYHGLELCARCLIVLPTFLLRTILRELSAVSGIGVFTSFQVNLVSYANGGGPFQVLYPVGVRRCVQLPCDPGRLISNRTARGTETAKKAESLGFLAAR